MKYWPAERCEVCGTWLFLPGTPGLDAARRYQTEAQYPRPQLKTFELFPLHTPARCRSLKGARP